MKTLVKRLDGFFHPIRAEKVHSISTLIGWTTSRGVVQWNTDSDFESRVKIDDSLFLDRDIKSSSSVMMIIKIRKVLVIPFRKYVLFVVNLVFVFFNLF